MSLNNLSDEDFLKEPEPVVVSEDEPLGTSQETDEPAIIEPDVEPVDEPSPVDDEPTDVIDDPTDELPSSNKEKKGNKSTETEIEDLSQFNEDPVAFYEKLTGSIKADGKNIQFKNSDEIISAIQQGVNYTRKMQELSKDRKLISTLKKHNLDESRISYAIDLLNGNQEAIKKLIADNKLDVMSLSDNGFEDNPVQYQGSNHIVSDAEVELQESIAVLRANPRGNELAANIQSWDDVTRDFLQANPSVIKTLSEHVTSGVYDTILNEINRRQLVGTLPQGPFISHYQNIGNELFGSEGSKPQETPAPVNTPQRKPIGTGTGKPQGNYKGAPNTKASSAASPRSNTGTTGKIKIAELSDEELMLNAAKIEAGFNK